MRRLDIQLEELNQQLLEMGALVASSVHRSALSLIERNQILAHQVIRDEAIVDQMEMQIDDLVASMIVRSQPVASDMRMAISAIKIDTDLERMGDLAVGIVERALSLVHKDDVPSLDRFATLSKLVEDMVLESLDSFVKRDPDAARRVLQADDAVDNQRDQIARELIELMQSNPVMIPVSLDLFVIARNLERIADHATNVAEEVIFLVKGENVRHPQDAIANA